MGAAPGYVPTRPVALAIERCWPDGITVKSPDFAARMARLQAAMIRAHLPAMLADDQGRAQRTLGWLEGAR